MKTALPCPKLGATRKNAEQRTIYALVSDQGTAAAETGCCANCYCSANRAALANAAHGDVCREAGFVWPIAMTAEAYHEAVGNAADLPPTQDRKGRMWDVLMLLRWTIKCVKHRDAQELLFQVRVWDGSKQNVVRLKSVAGPGDNGEPVLTLMMEHES